MPTKGSRISGKSERSESRGSGNLPAFPKEFFGFGRCLRPRRQAPRVRLGPRFGSLVRQLVARLCLLFLLTGRVLRSTRAASRRHIDVISRISALAFLSAILLGASRQLSRHGREPSTYFHVTPFKSMDDGVPWTGKTIAVRRASVWPSHDSPPPIDTPEVQQLYQEFLEWRTHQ